MFHFAKPPTPKAWQVSQDPPTLIGMWPVIGPVAAVPLWQFVQVPGCTPALTWSKDDTERRKPPGIRVLV
jgi:hypothetical protein